MKCKKEGTQCSVLVGTFETTFARLAVDVLVVVPANGKVAVKLTQFRDDGRVIKQHVNEKVTGTGT